MSVRRQAPTRAAGGFRAPDTLRALTFGNKSGAAIAAGGELASDAVSLSVRPFESLTVTLYFTTTTGPATFHSQAWTDSYRAPGDHLSDSAEGAYTQRTSSWYYLTDVEVAGGEAVRDTVVAFGDSITDGFGATPGANHRWPDALAERLADAAGRRSVLNAGIGGNLVVNDPAWYGDVVVFTSRPRHIWPSESDEATLARMGRFAACRLRLPPRVTRRGWEQSPSGAGPVLAG